MELEVLPVSEGVAGGSGELGLSSHETNFRLTLPGGEWVFWKTPTPMLAPTLAPQPFLPWGGPQAGGTLPGGTRLGGDPGRGGPVAAYMLVAGGVLLMLASLLGGYVA